MTQVTAQVASHDSPVVKSYALGHGTLECRNLKESRHFYEEFLGLECVRHAMPAMAIRLGGSKFHVFCVEVGDNLHPTNLPPRTLPLISNASRPLTTCNHGGTSNRYPYLYLQSVAPC